jgi:hypothetical protein
MLRDIAYKAPPSTAMTTAPRMIHSKMASPLWFIWLNIGLPPMIAGGKEKASSPPAYQDTFLWVRSGNGNTGDPGAQVRTLRFAILGDSVGDDADNSNNESAEHYPFQDCVAFVIHFRKHWMTSIDLWRGREFILPLQNI